MESAERLSLAIVLRNAYTPFCDCINSLKQPIVLLSSSLLIFLGVSQVLLTFFLLQNVQSLPIFLSWMQLWQGLLAAWCFGEIVSVFPSLRFYPLPEFQWDLLLKLCPAALCYSLMLISTNLLFSNVTYLFLFPLTLCIPSILTQIAIARHPGPDNTYISCHGVAMVAAALIFLFTELTAVLPWVALYTVVTLTYRSFYIPKITHIVQNKLSQLQLHLHLIGCVFVLLLILISGEIGSIISIWRKDQAIFIFGSFVAVASFPFAKEIVANYIIRHSGVYLWRLLEIVSIAIIVVIGLCAAEGLSWLHLTIMLLVLGRSYNLCYLMHRNVFKNKKDVGSDITNPYFLASLEHKSPSLQRPLLETDDTATESTESFSLREDFERVIKAYLTRSFCEELEMIDSLGGPQGIAKLLETDVKEGHSSSPYAISMKKGQFGENALPQREPTPFINLCLEAASDFTLRILMLCGAVSTLINVMFSKHPELEWIEGFAIWVAVLIVVLVTAGNDWVKEKQFQKLNAVKEDKVCSVIRDGTKHQISVFNLVVGDILCIETGDELPADCLVVAAKGLKLDESSLTGETTLISKTTFEECFAEANKHKGTARKEIGHHEIDSPVALSGTTVSSGSATCLVICVGKSSQVGQMFQKLAFDAEPTPLQKKLNSIAVDIGNLGFGCACVTLAVLLLEFWILYFLEDAATRPSSLDVVEEHVYFFITTVTIIVVAVPEGLPLAVTISLAYSIGQMLVDKNYVRRLAACEIMGGANEICSDKTGTLTTNQMVVQAFWNGAKDTLKNIEASQATISESRDYLQILARCIALNSTGYLDTEYVNSGEVDGALLPKIKYVGSPTECALLKFLGEIGYSYEELRKQEGNEENIVHRNEFSSQTKIMSTIISVVHEGHSFHRLYVKGAAEIVLRLCVSRFDQTGNIVSLSSNEVEAIENSVITPFAQTGLRTLCIAFKDISDATLENLLQSEAPVDPVSNLTCLGIAGIRDPVRREVPDAVLGCQRAGIRVRMITGDNIATAKQIARECHIYDEEGGGLAMSGSDFYKTVGGVVCKLHRTEVCECATDEKTAKYQKTTLREDVLGNVEAFKELLGKLQVVARSQATDKYALVTGLKQLGAVVAVTGDGVNDAPALKKADVGFAMGIAGKEISKQAADIVLLDDNFFSIVQAVKWGRSIYDNIRRFLQFQLTVNIVAVSLAFMCSVIARQSPLDAVQMLWVNLIMDSFASLALATEKPTQDLLYRKPHSRNEYLVNKTMTRSILLQAIYQIVVLTIIIFFGERFIPESRWTYVSSDLRAATGFCEFSDCNADTGIGTLIRSGRHFTPFSKSIDYSRDWDVLIGPSRHFTIVFNTFVLMQLFNMINARKVIATGHVFANFFSNSMWLTIWILLIVSQILLVQFGGFFLKCHLQGLTLTQWALSTLFGSGSLLVGYLIPSIPLELLPELGNKEVDPLITPQSYGLQARGRTPERVASRLQFIRSFISAKRFARRARLRTKSRLDRLTLERKGAAKT